MKRKLGIFALTAALLISLAACAETNVDDPSESSDPSQSGEGDYTHDPVYDSSNEYISTSDTVLTGESASTTEPEDTVNLENGIVQTAEALIGIPFAENGTTPSEGFDNSGFIYYVLRENGFINCPRLTPDQAAMGTHIEYDKLKSGDLAFFSTADSGKPDFGGIYIGEGKMIYSPMPGQTVKIADITSDYWKNSFVIGVSLS